MSPQVCAIVLNWNGWRDTLRCLESLFTSTQQSLHVVLIDNGSNDDSTKHLATFGAGVAGESRQTPHHDVSMEFLRLDRNVGFTGGVNAGLRRSLDLGAQYAFLLNNDATVEPDCISVLVEAASRRTDVGLVGPMISRADDKACIWSSGMSVTWRHAGVVAHCGEADDGRFHGRRLVQGLSACALLVKRGVIERVGLLDERYFAYYEDLDWCLRARAAGFRCLFAGDARVTHAVSASTNRGAGRSQSALANYYGARNALLFTMSHAPAAVRPLALASLVVRLFAAEARIAAGGLALHRPDAHIRARAIAAGVVDAARGRFGPADGVMQ